MSGNILENLKGKCVRKARLTVGITGLGLSIYLMEVELPFLCTTQKSKRETKRVTHVHPIEKPSKTFLPSEKWQYEHAGQGNVRRQQMSDI